MEGIEFASDVSHLEEICDEAFINTYALSNYDEKTCVFPEGLIYIGRQAFYNTYNLFTPCTMTGYNFPSSLQWIGERAFANSHPIGANAIFDDYDIHASLVFRGAFNPNNFGVKTFSLLTGKN
ncbi:leucine-rich repeat protein [bacterium]|nr:leucine-rich repeat protein [bacterium]